MIDGNIFIPPKTKDKYLNTPEEAAAFMDELLKQEILERIGEAIKLLADCYEFAREPDTNKFLVKAFSSALAASQQIKIIKSKCNYDGAFEE